MEPKSLIQIISEEEFLILLQGRCGSFFRTFNALGEISESSTGVTRKFYSSLNQEAEWLESFLDEHGARENKTWARFTEYVASIRNLVKAAFFCRHITDRYPYYKLRDNEESEQGFFRDAAQVQQFLSQAIFKLYEECVREGGKNNRSVPENSVDPEGFGEVEANKRLPKNTEGDEVVEQEDRIIDLLEKLNSAESVMQSMNVEPTQDPKTLRELVPGRLDEKKARMLMNLIHSTQSEFDTYIKSTPLEQTHEEFKTIRGYISMPLHLLEMMIWMIHFYERHEDDIRKGEARTIISGLVIKTDLLAHVVNFCFFYTLYYVQEGGKLSRKVLKYFVKSVRYELPVPEPLGFHARPSTYVSKIVRRYDAEAWLIIDGEKFDARSVMSLLQAGGVLADKGYKTAVFEGDRRVLDDLKILASHNYCEEKEVPEQLEYLRGSIG